MQVHTAIQLTIEDLQGWTVVWVGHELAVSQGLCGRGISLRSQLSLY